MKEDEIEGASSTHRMEMHKNIVQENLKRPPGMAGYL
jgi:hypothetical protein